MSCAIRKRTINHSNQVLGGPIKVAKMIGLIFLSFYDRECNNRSDDKEDQIYITCQLHTIMYILCKYFTPNYMIEGIRSRKETLPSNLAVQRRHSLDRSLPHKPRLL